MTTAPKIGRPSDYNEEIASLILDRLADGESLRAICQDEGMPDRASVRRWIIADESFRSQYARARGEQGDHYADEIVAISDNTDEDANSRRVRIDARKWAAGKLRPDVYGEKITQKHEGEFRVILSSADADL
jgi:hypothetical protein